LIRFSEFRTNKRCGKSGTIIINEGSRNSRWWKIRRG